MAISVILGFSAGSTDQQGFTSGSFDDSGANLRVLFLIEQGAHDGVITDSDANTWVLVTRIVGGFAASLSMWYAAGIAGGSGKTISVTGTNSFPAFSMLSVSGADSSPFDQYNEFSALFQSSIQGGSVTPTTDDQLVASGVGDLGDFGTPTIDGGFTIEELLANDGQHLSVGLAQLIQTTAAAANPTWTFGGLESFVINGTFKAQAGGGGDTLFAQACM